MSKKSLVFSMPTMCLKCSFIVAMTHESDADPVKGAWTCPKCSHIYPFAHWKIRKDLKATRRQSEKESQ